MYEWFEGRKYGIRDSCMITMLGRLLDYLSTNPKLYPLAIVELCGGSCHYSTDDQVGKCLGVERITGGLEKSLSPSTANGANQSSNNRLGKKLAPIFSPKRGSQLEADKHIEGGNSFLVEKQPSKHEDRQGVTIRNISKECGIFSSGYGLCCKMDFMAAQSYNCIIELY